MKHDYFRVYMFVFAFLFIIFSGYYFESYKTGGPIILLPIGNIVRGMVSLIVGIIVLIDTFLDYRKWFSKRKKFLIDYPFMLSFLFILGGLFTIAAGIQYLYFMR